MKILISTDYGAGWVTWNSLPKKALAYMLTCPYLIEALENGEKLYIDRSFDLEKPGEDHHPLIRRFEAEMEERFGQEDPDNFYICVLGADNLRVVGVTPPFLVNEYDGAESVSEQETLPLWNAEDFEE